MTAFQENLIKTTFAKADAQAKDAALSLCWQAWDVSHRHLSTKRFFKLCDLLSLECARDVSEEKFAKKIGLQRLMAARAASTVRWPF